MVHVWLAALSLLAISTPAYADFCAKVFRSWRAPYVSARKIEYDVGPEILGKYDLTNPSRMWRDTRGRFVFVAQEKGRFSELGSRLGLYALDINALRFSRFVARRVDTLLSFEEARVEDPFVFQVRRRFYVGVVRVDPRGSYRTEIYELDLHVMKLLPTPVVRGPEGMKDIRIAELADGWPIILTGRPNGYIGVTMASQVETIKAEALERARPFLSPEALQSRYPELRDRKIWIAATDIQVRGDTEVVVYGHVGTEGLGPSQMFRARVKVKGWEIVGLELLADVRDFGEVEGMSTASSGGIFQHPYNEKLEVVTGGLGGGDSGVLLLPRPAGWLSPTSQD